MSLKLLAEQAYIIKQAVDAKEAVENAARLVAKVANAFESIFKVKPEIFTADRVEVDGMNFNYEHRDNTFSLIICEECNYTTPIYGLYQLGVTLTDMQKKKHFCPTASDVPKIAPAPTTEERFLEVIKHLIFENTYQGQ